MKRTVAGLSMLAAVVLSSCKVSGPSKMETMAARKAK